MQKKIVSEKTILVLIIGLYTFLGIIYAVTTPVFEASDELWHYPMVKHLADGNSLPVQVFDPSLAGPWKQEASQPPLYYYLGAALTFWIDTSDMEQVRWLNPHVDNGVITEDGNINLVVHDPNRSRWEGTQLAVTVVRLFSVALGAVTVYLTYRIAKLSAPGRREIALGAAAVNAFMPMFLFISGAVNNDNLIITLSSLALLIMISIGRKAGRTTKQEISLHIVLGIVIGLGALTKITAIGLFAMAGFAIFIGQWANRENQDSWPGLIRILLRSVGRLLIVFVPALLIAGWWYYRNIVLYGDWSGWNAFIAVLGQRAHPANLAQLWDERWGFMISFWGLFGGLNVPMPNWIYRLLNGVVVISVVGFVIYFVRLVKNWLERTDIPIKNLKTLLSNLLGFFERYLPLLLCLLWGTAVAIGLVRWATITWSSQGRLVFSALSALCTLLITGFVGWMPTKAARIAAAIFSFFLLAIASLAPFLWIEPAYDPMNFEIEVKMQPLNISFDNQLKLRGFQISQDELRPGQSLDVWLQWQVLSEIKEDWSVFVHLNDPVLGVPIAQRDMFFGQGLLATNLLPLGSITTNFYHIQIPISAIAPAELGLVVGLYDNSSGKRLQLEDGSDMAILDHILVKETPGEVPNPLDINFENKLALKGFSLSSRRLEQGDKTELMLFWEPLQQLEDDYTFFAQVVDQDTTRWASNDLKMETSNWDTGVIVPVRMMLDTAANTPVGVYPIIVGAYKRASDGSFDRLQTVTPEGRLTDDFVSLTAIRITEGS